MFFINNYLCHYRIGLANCLLFAPQAKLAHKQGTVHTVDNYNKSIER